MKKEKRQKKIMELIAERSIGTQEELTQALAEAGFSATQATVSRDIRELGLRKQSGDGRGSRYVAGSVGSSTTYRQILSSGMLSVEPAGNLIVIRTVSGAAMAVGAALDHMHLPGLVGCIAGDDTLFLAVRTLEEVEPMMLELRKHLG
ncbi:MAG: arginine repressor [Eubacterium sp.]|jgi:transcriptional regulator of arginine metabolism|nr:arginine repressor [Eubacterium sp.]